VQHARDASQDHVRAERQRRDHVLAVALADRRRMRSKIWGNTHPFGLPENNMPKVAVLFILELHH